MWRCGSVDDVEERMYSGGGMRWFDCGERIKRVCIDVMGRRVERRRGSQTGVHVPPGVHLYFSGGTLNLRE